MFRLLSPPALALPANPVLVSGNAAFSSSGDTLNIVADNDQLNWRGFSVVLGQTVNFIQSSSSPGAANRLRDGSVLEIFGVFRSNRPLTLRADNIYIAPGGVIDAPGPLLLGAQSVNMAGLVQGAWPLNITSPSYSGVFDVNQPSIAASVPEPSKWMMFVVGLMTFFGMARRRSAGWLL